MSVDIFRRTDVRNTQKVFSAGVTLSQVNNAFLRLDGENTATDNIDLDSHKSVKVVDPIDPQDVATKNYVDSSKVAKTGDTMTGNLLLKSGKHKLRRIGCYDLNENNAFSVLLVSATNQKEYRLNQPIEMQTSNGLLCKRGGFSIIKFGGDDANKTQAYQDIHMNSHSITDLREPTAAQDAATKNYVDNSTGPAFSALGTSQINPQGGKKW